MKRLTVLATIALATLGMAQAQDPTFKAQLDRLAQQAQAQLAATDQKIAQALREGPTKAPVVAPAARPAELDAVGRAELAQALDRLARCTTGKLVKDADSALWVPELKARCR